MGKFSDVLYHRATGSGALSSTFDPKKNVVLVAILFHLDSAPTTVEDFLTQKDSGVAVNHDAIIFRADMVAANGDAIRFFEGDGFPIDKDSKLVFTYTNTDAKTFGLELAYVDEEF